MEKPGKIEPELIVPWDTNQSSSYESSTSTRSVFPGFLENSQDLLCTHDLEGRLLSVNTPPARILGYTVEELLEHTLPELLAPEYAALFDKYLEQIRRQGMATGLMTLLTRTGERRIWEYHNWLRVNPDRSHFVLGMAHDVTKRVAAERSLRANEKKFHSIFQDAPVGMVVATKQGRILEVNESFAEFLGYSPEELLGKTVLEITYRDDLEPTLFALEQASIGKQVVHALEKRYIHKNGDLRWGQVSASLLTGDTPDSGYFISQILDVTEPKKAEEQQKLNLRQTTLLWTIGHLVGGSGSVEQLANAVSDAVVQQLGWEVALVFQTESNNLLLRSLSLRGPLLQAKSTITPFIRDCLCGIALREGRPVYCPDTLCDARCTLHECKDNGLRSFAALPLRDGEEIIGVLGIGSTTPHDFEQSAPFLETLAVEVSAGFSNCLLRLRLTERAAQLEREVAERKRAEQTLQDREERLRMMVQQMPGILWAVDRDLRFTSSTGRALKELGLRENQVRGMSLAEFLNSDDPALPIISSHQRALEGETAQYEFEWSGRTYEVLVGPLREAANSITGALGVAVDITELRRNTQRLQTLLEVSHCAASHLEPQALLSAVSACLRRVIKQDFAGLLAWDATRGLLQPVAFDFLSEGYGLENLLDIAAKDFDTSPFTGHEVRVLGPVDLENNSFFSSLIQAGICSFCCVPLETADGPQGTLLLGSKRNNIFSASFVHLLTEVAPQLALGLANVRAYQQVKQVEEKLSQEKIYLEQEIQAESRFDKIVGRSQGLVAVLDLVKKVAPTDANVLITGETGTGKEVIARAIHQISVRSHNSFIKLNCAAIPSGLLESELFGYERGAFTSASTRKIGRIELADQGTLFLDEVGDLPLELQPKLLRVLEDHEFERLGSSRTVRVNTRLIAATNCDLVKDVADGEFRADLFFRLNVFPIKMPALRERRLDIPLLVTHFVHKHATRMKKTIDQIPVATMSMLTNWGWAGNIRELENFIERSVILTKGSVLEAPLAELTTPSDEMQDNLQTTTAAMQRDQIIRALQETAGVISGPTGAAARLGMKRTTLQSMMRRLDIPLGKYRINP